MSECLAAFQADLEARGVSQRTLTLVWSEFGRRPGENGSGTDHGAGGVAWVQGDRARGRGPQRVPEPGPARQHDNLKVTIDFRRVYSSLLEQQLGTDAASVIPNARRLGPRPAAEVRRALAARPGARRGARRRRPRRRRETTSVGVGEREWRVSLYRTACRGRVRFNVHNYGEDGHDLALRNRDGRVLGRLAELRPGEREAHGAGAPARPLRGLLLARGPRGEGHARDAHGQAEALI